VNQRTLRRHFSNITKCKATRSCMQRVGHTHGASSHRRVHRVSHHILCQARFGACFLVNDEAGHAKRLRSRTSFIARGCSGEGKPLSRHPHDRMPRSRHSGACHRSCPGTGSLATRLIALATHVDLRSLLRRHWQEASACRHCRSAHHRWIRVFPHVYAIARENSSPNGQLLA
jgi:hypothetical protein